MPVSARAKMWPGRVCDGPPTRCIALFEFGYFVLRAECKAPYDVSLILSGIDLT